MKPLYLITFLSIILLLSSESFAYDDEETFIYAKIFNDENACENSIPVIVIAPEKFEGHDFRTALFSLNDGERFFESALEYRDDLVEGGGIVFCLDKLSLKHAFLNLDYGYRDCVGSIHSFRLRGLDKIITQQHVFAKLTKHFGKRVPVNRNTSDGK